LQGALHKKGKMTYSDKIPIRSKRYERIFAILGLRSQGKWIIFGLILGGFSAIGAWLFFYGLAWLRFLLQGWLAGAPVLEAEGEQIIHVALDKPFIPWLFFLLPALGGLVSGLLVYNFAPEAEGEGTDSMIEAFHHKEGNIRTRIPFIKGIASLAVLASGGSAGREGPIAQIGAGIGSWFARVLKFNVEERRIMMLMGAGGGLGAIFRAPFGGAVTAIEVLYKDDLETSAIIPTIFTSVTAYAIFSSIFGYHHIFSMPDFKFNDIRELGLYAVLGFLLFPVGALYANFFHGINKAFKRLRIPRMYKPMLGGLLVGCIGLGFPQIYSGGYGVLQQALLGHLTPEFKTGLLLLLSLMFFKIVATGFTLGSGGSGGIFAPTMFIGGMLGGAVGLVGHHFWPEVVTQPEAYVVVGMAGFFSSMIKTPLGAILMTMEMTGGYGLLAPLLLVTALGMVFTRPWAICEKQLDSRLDSPAHIGDFTVNILRDMKVEDVFQPSENITYVPEDMTFEEVKRLIARTPHNTFPVVDRDGVLKGVLSVRSARAGMFEDTLNGLVLAKDITQPATYLNLSDSLYEALIKFVETDYGQLPVKDPENENRILGFFTHENLMRAYRNEMIRRKVSEDVDEALRAPPKHRH